MKCSWIYTSGYPDYVLKNEREFIHKSILNFSSLGFPNNTSNVYMYNRKGDSNKPEFKHVNVWKRVYVRK